MPTEFMSLWSRVKSNNDRVFGETFTLKPRASKTGDENGRTMPDATRDEVTFTGVWRDPHALIYPHSPGHADSNAERWGSDKPTVDYDTPALPYQVRQGDILVRGLNGTFYQISDVADDGFTRTTLALTATRKAA